MTMASSRVYAYATTRVHVYKYCGQVALDTVSATNGFTLHLPISQPF